MTLEEAEKIREEAKPKAHNQAFLDAVNGIMNDTINNRPNIETKKPIISIVTIYDEENERLWLQKYLDNLPQLSSEQAGQIEVILCYCKPIGTPETKPSETVTRYGVQISTVHCYYEQWNFAEARNLAKEAAQGEWILSLDTDEYIIHNQIQKILDTVRIQHENVGAIKTTIVSHHRDLDGVQIAEAVPSQKRLFRNIPELVWQCRVHETVEFSLHDLGYTVNDSAIVIMHEGYEVSDIVLKRKLSRNLDLAMKEYTYTKNQQIRDFCWFYVLQTSEQLIKYKDIK